jgi:tellurite resistance protein TerC
LQFTAVHWIGFFIILFILLSFDLGIFNKKSHRISFKEAILYTILWITVALIFDLIIYNVFDHRKALDFLTGYLLEYSLSVDNIFVFLLIFSYFKVEAKYQHKVLFWGIIGAIVFRLTLIFVGTELMKKFEWIIYVFGIFLIISGIRMLFPSKEEGNIEKNPLVNILKKIFPVTSDFVNGKFFVKQSGKFFMTPLFIVLTILESTDIVFALDSIPAVLSITQDPFIVFTSNAFAILGLRSLYFAIAGFMDKFRFLKVGLSIILVYIGIKMCISDIVHISTEITLLILFVILSLSVLLSIIIKPKKE